MSNRSLVAGILFSFALLHSVDADPPETVSRSQGLTRTPTAEIAHAVVGQEARIYFANIWEHRKEPIGILGAADRMDGQPTKIVDFGKVEQDCWKFTPTSEEAGKRIKLLGLAAADRTAASDIRLELRIAPADAGAGREIAILIVGDSLTHATHYPNEWARLLNQPGNPKWTILGTHKPANAQPGVAHEGYGGWRWQTFLERYEPKPDPAKRIHSSPFVFVGADDKPGLDLPRYFREACGGRKPDYVTFLLGINDCFAAPADDAAALDKHIDGVFANADKLLAAFREAAPDAKLAVCLTPPPNSRAEAFTANYKGKYPRDGWLKIQRRLVERQMQHFGDREAERIYVVPTNLDLDTVAGYPPDNAVHPNKDGYARIAASLHAWLKWQLYEESLAEKRR